MFADLRELCHTDANIAAIQAYVRTHGDVLRKSCSGNHGNDVMAIKNSAKSSASAPAPAKRDTSSTPPQGPRRRSQKDYHTQFYIKQQAAPLYADFCYFSFREQRVSVAYILACIVTAS